MKTHFVKKELHILDNVRGKPITCIELGILSIGLYNGFNFCIYNELSKRKFGLDFLSCTARDLWQSQTFRNAFEGHVFHWICRTSMVWKKHWYLCSKWGCWLFPDPAGTLPTDPILRDSVLICESRTNWPGQHGKMNSPSLFKIHFLVKECMETALFTQRRRIVG